MTASPAKGLVSIWAILHSARREEKEEAESVQFGVSEVHSVVPGKSHQPLWVGPEEKLLGGAPKLHHLQPERIPHHWIVLFLLQLLQGSAH